MLIQCSSECLISLQPNEAHWQRHIWQFRPQRFRIGAATRPVGLVDRLTHLAKQLPGGQEQRIAIARAWVADPDPILAPATSTHNVRTDIRKPISERLIRQGSLALINSLRALPSTFLPANFAWAAFITRPICALPLAPVSAIASATAASSSSALAFWGR